MVQSADVLNAAARARAASGSGVTGGGVVAARVAGVTAGAGAAELGAGAATEPCGFHGATKSTGFTGMPSVIIEYTLPPFNGLSSERMGTVDFTWLMI